MSICIYVYMSTSDVAAPHAQRPRDCWGLGPRCGTCIYIYIDIYIYICIDR